MTIQLPGEENEIQKFLLLFSLHPFSYLHNIGNEMQNSTSSEDAQRIYFDCIAEIILIYNLSSFNVFSIILLNLCHCLF